MYELFEDTRLPKYPVVKIGQIDYIKRTYTREMEKVIDYYSTRVSRIDNDHILNRLIVTGSPNTNYDLLKYVHICKVRASTLADNFEFTSSELYGKLRNGQFYSGCKELILFDDDDFDEEYVYKNWKEVDAVKVLSHPFSDLRLVPPFGQEYTDKKGLLVVLSINISKLLVQYKAFMDSRLHLPDQERLYLGSMHFLKMHVLPNILRTHLDFVFYNRLKNMFYVTPGYECKLRLPFHIVDQTAIVDDMLSYYLEKFENQPLTYVQFLQNCPAIVKTNALEALHMPDLAKTKQVYWALFLTRLEDMFFLIHLLGENGYKNNRRYIEKMLFDCKWFLRDNTFKYVLENSIYRGYLADMKDFSKRV